MKNFTTFVRGTLAVAAVGVITAFAPVAQADTLHTTGFAEGYYTFGLSTGQTVRTGGFEGEWNGTQIEFWCVELEQHFSFGQNYTSYVPLPELSDPVVTLLGKLFTRAHDDALLDTDHSAAFQLAIWEIVYDSTNLNLTSGALSVTQANGHTNTMTIAQNWLTNLASFTDAYHLMFLRSPERQDFVTFGRPFRSTSVPEPHGIALVALAMLAMVGILRGRRRQPLA